MKKVNFVIQIVLGVLLLIFGLNKFFGFLPMMPMPATAANFGGALMATGYMMNMIAIVEVLVGALLVINKFVPLALLFLAPLTVNIIAFHLFLDLSGIGPGALVALLNIYLFFVYRSAYKGVLKA
ncbi:MAG TPA: DoxX family membrane protein [Williamwhitmania sp.]|nr:DoxX family membrane protein [Williamwhitmania sp.]